MPVSALDLLSLVEEDEPAPVTVSTQVPEDTGNRLTAADLLQDAQKEELAAEPIQQQSVQPLQQAEEQSFVSKVFEPIRRIPEIVSENFERIDAVPVEPFPEGAPKDLNLIADRLLKEPLKALSILDAPFQALIGEPVTEGLEFFGVSETPAEIGGLLAEIAVPLPTVRKLSAAQRLTDKASTAADIKAGVKAVQKAEKLAKQTKTQELNKIVDEALAKASDKKLDEIADSDDIEKTVDQVLGKSIPDKAGNLNIDRMAISDEAKLAVKQVARSIPLEKTTYDDILLSAREAGIETSEDVLKLAAKTAVDTRTLTAMRMVLAKSANRLGEALKAAHGNRTPENVARFEQLLAEHKPLQALVAGKFIREKGTSLGALNIIARGQDKTGKAITNIRDIQELSSDEILDMAGELLEDERHMFWSKVQKTGVDVIRGAEELFLASIFSGTGTHLSNIVSNAFFATYVHGVEKTLAVGISKLPGTGTKRHFGQIPARAYGLFEAQKDAFMAFGREIHLGKKLAKSKVEFKPRIPGKIGEGVRITLKLLSGEDEYFKAINRRASLYADAYEKAGGNFKKVSDLVRNPTRAMRVNAEKTAHELTFTTPLGDTGKKFQAVQNIPGMRFVVPVLRTPVNILKQSLIRTPLGAAQVKRLKNPKTRADVLAEVIGGTTVMTLVGMAGSGLITGSQPINKRERNAFFAAGGQANSVRIGDQLIQTNRMTEPLATIITVAADLDARLQTGETSMEDAVEFIFGVGRIMQDKTFMEGFSNFILAVSRPEQYGGSFIRRFASSMVVPNIVNELARETDPFIRDTRKSLGSTIASRLPHFRDSLDPLRDIYGEPVRNQKLFPGAPAKITSVEDSLLRTEISRLQNSLGWGFSLPKDTIDIEINGKSEKYRLSDAEWQEFQIRAGRRTRAMFERTVTSPKYRRRSDTEKADLLSNNLRSLRRSEYAIQRKIILNNLR